MPSTGIKATRSKVIDEATREHLLQRLAAKCANRREVQAILASLESRAPRMDP